MCSERVIELGGGGGGQPTKSVEAFLAGSSHTPGFAFICAFGAQGLTPTLSAVMLLRASVGSSARVVPGTSRRDSTEGRGTPSSSARLRAREKLKSITSEVSACSYSMLKAPAWKYMSPAWIAARSSDTAAGVGQRSVSPESVRLTGQWRNSERSQECEG